jgi:hypothetical protein
LTRHDLDKLAALWRWVVERRDDGVYHKAVGKTAYCASGLHDASPIDV